MRVLHVYRTYYPDSKGGIQESIRQICIATKEFGIESTIYTLSPNPNPKTLLLPEGLVYRKRSWMAPASCDIGTFDSIAEFKKLAGLADVIHYHFPWPFLDILQLFQPNKKPCVLTYHSDIVKQKFLNKLYYPIMRHTLRCMSSIIATSPNYLSTSPVLRDYLLSNKVTVIPLGINRPQPNTNQFDDANLGFLNQIGVKSGEYLLFIGVLRYYKGLYTLINAAQSIQGQIIIAGDGPEGSYLKKLTKLYKLNNVIFIGEVSERRKQFLLNHCAALVLPSHLRSEAFGMVLLEACMYAKPMICCEISSGTSYVNAHGLTGLVVGPEDPITLSEACNQLLTNIPLAKKMGQAALERYESLFSGQMLGKAHFELYSKLLGTTPIKGYSH